MTLPVNYFYQQILDELKKENPKPKQDFVSSEIRKKINSYMEDVRDEYAQKDNNSLRYAEYIVPKD